MNEIGIHETHERAGAAVLWFGAVWGLLEATVGFGLHLLPRILPVPNVAGAVMFPLALLCMVAAVRSTGRPTAAMGTAIVAAAIKVASLALPVVSFAFVRSPVLAILAEGAIVTAAATAGLVPFARDGDARRFASTTARVAIGAVGLSVGWRAAFLLLNAILGVQRGIMAKPASVIVRFATVEALGSALVIAAVVLIATRRASRPASSRNARLLLVVPAPAWGVLIATLAVAAELSGALVQG